MKLELASGRVVPEATPEDLRTSIAGEDFAVLTSAPHAYIQCGQVSGPPFEYVLEYREGGADRHYHATDEPITLDRVLAAFTGYLQGDPEWKAAFRWEKLEMT